MSGEAEKQPIPGISELPVVPGLPPAAAESSGDAPGNHGADEEIEALDEEIEHLDEEVGIEEVVRLGVDNDGETFEARLEVEKKTGRTDVGRSVDAGLGSEANLDEHTEEDEGDVEDTWEGGSRRAAPIGLMVLTGLVVIAGLGVGYWHIPSGDERLRSRAAEVSEKLAVEQQELEEAAALMDRIEDVLRRYLAAETIEEKARFVRDPERVLPLMRAYYQDHELVPQRYERVKSFYPVGVENYPFLVVQAGLESGEVLPLLLQQVGEEEIRLDWESEVAYQPMTMEAFLRKRPETGVDFRVYVSYDQFYAFEFADPAKFVSLMLTERNSDGFLFGYVERGGQAHEEIARLLDQTESPQEAMLLKLRFLPGSLGTRSVLVEEVVAPRWAYVDGTGH